MQTKLAALILLLAFLLNPCIVIVRANSSGEIDKTGVVNWVEDGDTFYLTSGEAIRLADVNAPDENETGYSVALSFMINLVWNKTVYLDIDDISRNDSWNRLICVAYVDYNSTHYENVNKALLVENYAVVNNFTNNEFNPSNWVLYVPKSAIPTISPEPTSTPTPTPTLTPLPNVPTWSETIWRLVFIIIPIIIALVILLIAFYHSAMKRKRQLEAKQKPMGNYLTKISLNK